jgi:ATP-dependent Lon protease
MNHNYNLRSKRKISSPYDDYGSFFPTPSPSLESTDNNNIEEINLSISQDNSEMGNSPIKEESPMREEEDMELFEFTDNYGNYVNEEEKNILKNICKLEKLKKNEIEEIINFFESFQLKDVTLSKIMNNKNIPSLDKYHIIRQYIANKLCNPFSAARNDGNKYVNMLIENYNEELNENQERELKRLKSTRREIKIKDILDSNFTDHKKLLILDTYKYINTLDPITIEYDRQYKRLLKLMTHSSIDDLEYEINNSHLSNDIKRQLLDCAENILDPKDTDSESNKHLSWIRLALKLPHNIRKLPIDNFENLGEFEKDMRRKLDENCYGMDDTKELIIDQVFKFICNPDATNNLIPLEGPKGVGKTNIAQAIASSLGRSLIRISMGGATDAVKIVGHSRTYSGAVPGEIIREIANIDHMNPVIFFDEIDKMDSRAGRQDEVTGTLIHVLDPLQNSSFKDEFLGFPFDLSKVLFVVAFNDRNRINPILLNRLKLVIKLKGYDFNDKFNICKNHLIPRTFKNLNLNNEIDIPDTVINHIINSVEKEDGMRNVEHMVDFIICRLNRCRLTNGKIGTISIESKTTLTSGMVDILLANIEKKDQLTYYL